MSYLVLARKYRPESFDSVSGQEHVTRTLSNAITRDQIGHAYVFTGPRGVGKTSIARIFAKCLNCAEGPTVSPCLQCQNCKEIAAGTSLAVREIDGASNNSVDNVRELIESFRTLPAPGSKYKVYIIDEVHMLSLSAFNALLKSLEEPPPHTVFILATTEPHKIPDTVLSRCQRHDLRTLPMSTIGERIEAIAEKERFSIEPGAVKIIAKLSEGSMRDAQTLLERARAYSEKSLTTREVSTILGSVDMHLLYELAECILDHNASGALLSVQKVFEQGADESVFLREFVSFFRDVHFCSLCESSQVDSFGITEDEYRDLKKLSGTVLTQDLADLADMAREGADRALRSSYPQYALESLVVRMSCRPPVKDIGRMLGKLRGMVAQQGGAVRGVAAPSTVLSPALSSAYPSASPKAEKKKPYEVATSVPQEDPPFSPPESPTKEAVKPKEVQQKCTFSYEDFVKFVNESGAVMVGELLRRVSVSTFDNGLLALKGPDFQIKSLQQEDTLRRISELLAGFSGHSPWRLEFSSSGVGGRATPDSLEGREEEVREKRRAKQKQEMLGNETVKAVMEAFPGSKIEKVRVRSNSHS
ncbi:MAG: DNA polymerase III subunit gamma/tau [Bdellovibrionales bacterium]|nr:DNA polymerase III subunit gamma/tau [Bdellovibrionales bacterium]